MSVSPKASFTLFGGSLFNFSFGGGGRRNRRRGGLFTRLTRLATRAYGEVTGKGSGPKSSGGGKSFDDFRTSRPDLFDDDQAAELDHDDDQGDAEGGDYVPDHAGQPGGPTTSAHCPACGHPAGGHSYSCEYRGYL